MNETLCFGLVTTSVLKTWANVGFGVVETDILIFVKLTTFGLAGKILSKNSELPDVNINKWPKKLSNRRIFHEILSKLKIGGKFKL